MACPEQWTRLKEIVGEALEREPGERKAFLDRVCSKEDSLRAEIESLLAAHEDAYGFSVQAWDGALSNAVKPATTIGPYRLQLELGCGGMGQVWLAKQTEPVERQVALKLIRAGLYDATIMQRFLAERQSLALMQHPAIAKVFDAGTTLAGQPYFVMEYVAGLPITTYCDSKGLGVADRLQLFLKVCEGVQHAHHKAIVHRDLKPSNILVIEVDGQAAPRIIDFGLAKNVQPARNGDAFLTQVGGFLGTPGYISPEQADPRGEDIDTRSDIYSLGVILYELLTGSLPFDPQRGKKRLDEVLREIRDTDPERPSVKALSSGNRVSSAGTPPRGLAKMLRGDLDSITLKALEKNRDRRYGTPSEMAADIERYFQGRPVMARAARPLYRLQKYIRRNRLAVAVTGSALALLIGFAIAQIVQLRHVERERARADRVTQFMTRIFKVSDPSEARGNNITAREILDKSSREIPSGLAEDPELQATLENLMGNVYEELGLYSQAQPLLERSAARRQKILGNNDPQTLKSMDDLAWLLHKSGHDLEAEKLQRSLLATRRLVQGPEHTDTQRSAGNLAATLGDEGRYAEAEKLQRDAIAAARRSFGPEHPRTLVAMNNLADTLEGEARYDEARTLLLQTLRLTRHSLGTDHPITLGCMTNLSVTLMHMGEYAKAEELLRETRDIQRRVFGPKHPETAGSTYNLACLAAQQGNRKQAVMFLREAVANGLKRKEALGIKDDTDFHSLLDDTEFRALVSEVQKRDADISGKSK